MIKGIDVSHWQGNINWKLVAQDDDNIKFAFVKATQGTNIVDSEFQDNVKGVKSVGLDLGAYHFATFRNIKEALVEAEFAAKILKGIKFEKGIGLDLESNRGNLNKKDLTDATIAFMDHLAELTGQNVLIYTNKNFYDNYLDMSRILPKYELWFARYGVSDAGVEGEDIWQFTDKGKVDGIKGYVDMNVIVEDDDVKESNAPAKSSPKKVSKRIKNADGTYTIKSGDTLSDIANEFDIDMDDIQEWNHIKNPNIISAGAKLVLHAPTKAKPLVKNSIYVVRKGDTLSGIALKYHTTVKDIMKINDIEDKDVISIGERIKLPNVSQPVKKDSPAPKREYVIVKSGMTVSELAQKYHSSIKNIKVWNKLDKNYTIYIGKKIRVK